MQNNSRRSVLKTIGAALGLGLIAPTVLSRKVLAQNNDRELELMADIDLPLADPSQDPARSLKYVHASPSMPKHCGNCMYYNAVGTRDNAVVGTCQLLPNLLVKDGGFCPYWMQKG